ncbi:Alcohol acetyltransferase [Fusarium falciforme]|nr:Alcohol acetyltransferase [Fusarium falciforme]
MQSSSESRVLRTLGRVERYQSALHLLDLYPSTVLTCHYKIPHHFITTPASQLDLEEFWERAVARNIIQHPLMQVGQVNEDSTEPAWVRLDTVDLSRHISWRLVSSLEDYPTIRKQILSEQLITKFTDLETRPGWRMVVLKQESDDLIEVILAWNHPHFDGTGAKIFHETMLETLNQAGGGSDLQIVRNHILETVVNRQNLPPPQETAGNYSTSFGYIADTIWEDVKPKLFGWACTHPAIWPPISPKPYETRFRTLTIDNQMLQGVLAACRAHKTTLTGLLHAISLISLTPHVPKEVSEVTGSTPLNLRRFIPARSEAFPDLEPDRTVSCCVTSTEHRFNNELLDQISDRIKTAADDSKLATCADIMWDVSARVREELQEKLSQGLKNDLVGMMGFISDWREHAKEAQRKPRAATWLVTNLGVLDGENGSDQLAGTWSIQRADFLLSADVAGPALTICPVAVKGRDLTINVGWQGGVVDDELGEQLVGDIEKCFRDVAATR